MIVARGYDPGMQLAGFHHLTAISADIVGNKRFYTQTLGMRLVKRSVNQDDVSSYHLFYADGAGSPGTDVTFFDWPARPERRGTRSIVRTGLRVDSVESLAWWKTRLDAASEIVERDGNAVLDFDDPEGQRLSLIVAPEASPKPWARGPVPAEHQIRGLASIAISVPQLAPTERVLTGVMSMRKVRKYDGNVTVFAMGDGGPSAELHVHVEPDAPVAHPGAGGCHHVAFRVPTLAEYDQWWERLQQYRVPSSGPVDRFYFRILYFLEPYGFLFELETDEPGFHADEPIESMGERLALPPFLEPRRAEIEAGLKPI